MKIRLEFGESKSKIFPWVLRLCRAFPSFRAFRHDEMMIYSVTFKKEDIKSFEAIWCKVGGWQNTALYLDGKLICAGDLLAELRRMNCDFDYRSANDDEGKALDKKTAQTQFLEFLRRQGTLSNPN